MFPFILAGIDPQQIVGICVLVFSLLGWIINVAQGKTPDGAPRPQKPKPKPPPQKSEIEILLQDLTVEKPKDPPKREVPRAVEPVRRQPQPPKPPKSRVISKPAQRPGDPPPYTVSRPPVRSNVTTLTQSDLGGAIRSHQMGSRVESEVAQDITMAVKRDLGDQITTALPVQEIPIHPLVKVMRDPKGIRQAILINEILQPPKSRR